MFLYDCTIAAEDHIENVLNNTVYILLVFSTICKAYTQVGLETVK
jgi:hypothetical protein